MIRRLGGATSPSSIGREAPRLRPSWSVFHRGATSQWSHDMLMHQMHGATTGSAMTYRSSDVRAWARDSGEPVAVRGRLSYELVTAYLKAHPQVTRTLAAEHGLAAPARGAVSLATCEELAVLVR